MSVGFIAQPQYSQFVRLSAIVFPNWLLELVASAYAFGVFCLDLIKVITHINIITVKPTIQIDNCHFA